MRWGAIFGAVLRPWQSTPEDVALGQLANAYLTMLRMPQTWCPRSEPVGTGGAPRLRCNGMGGRTQEETQVFFEYWAVHGGPPPEHDS